MSTDTPAKSTVLITGASVGIGRELAKVFAAHGHDLILVARRKAKLAALARTLTKREGIETRVIPADLSAPDAPQALFDQVAELGLDVDILINNAGVLFGGAFRRMSQSDIDAMLKLNVSALTALARLYVEPMVARGTGHIVNLASLAAFQPVPSLAVYAATKAYVLSFSEALAEELKSKGVRVSVVCPGFTDTDMLRGSVEDNASESGMPGVLVMSPERVAQEAYDAIARGDVVKVPGLGNALVSAGVRLVPRWLVRNVSGFVVRGRR